MHVLPFGKDESVLTLDGIRGGSELGRLLLAEGQEAACPPAAPTCKWCSKPTCVLEQSILGNARGRKGGRRAAEVALRTCERAALERTVRTPTSSQRDSQRARVVLLAAQGLTNAAIAEELGVAPKAVGKWRRRFAEEGTKGLRDALRSGRPAVYTAEQKAWYFQKVLEEARDNGVPISRWTGAELVGFAKRAGLDPTPDPATLWRWLDEADLKPHKWRYWLQITDPNFEVRMKDVTGIYLQAIAFAKAGVPVFCMDEKTGMQALARETPDRPTRRGKARRRDHRYKRHGTTCFM